MIKKINYTRVFHHLLFWLLILLHDITSHVSNKSLLGDYWWGDWKIVHVLLISVAINALFVYGFIYVIIPRYLDTKKYIPFGFMTLIWLYIVSAVFSASYYYYLEHIYTVYLWFDSENLSTMYMRLTNIGFLIKTFSDMLFPTIIFGAIKFYKKKMMLSKVEEEKNRMELQLLKNQLNPHFLFNTLNNLYSYVVNQSPKAPDMILQLSGILDYVLYKSQNKSVPLSEEVETIEHFLKLEQIRYGDRLRVDYKTEGDMTSRISPLILLSLVENAFKHGASGDIDIPKIKITIKENKGIIYCQVWNTKTKYKGELNDAYKEGIGLSNIKRQLNLVYPQNHELDIDNLQDSFNVSLTIKPIHE